MPSRRNRKQSDVPSVTPMDVILAQHLAISYYNQCRHIMLAQFIEFTRRFYLGIGTLNGGVQNVTSTRPPTPIEAFFARYPEYPYDQSTETMFQFWEMSSQFGWGETVERESLDDLRDAIAQQFNDIYGADVNDLQAWQRLCGLVGDGNIPDNIAACRAVIRRVHVNICDLVDYPATTIPPPVFFTECALAKYSRESGKIFPRKNAYSGGLLRFLLRHIFHPTHDRGISSDNGRTSGSG
ncbi:hypothetical protein IW262DRAFT_366222 [Armillaria fumosa]|nr:hypothetical protein IW262DRAFT_366222 [Armillaria fumosa]